MFKVVENDLSVIATDIQRIGDMVEGFDDNSSIDSKSVLNNRIGSHSSRIIGRQKSITKSSRRSRRNGNTPEISHNLEKAVIEERSNESAISGGPERHDRIEK